MEEKILAKFNYSEGSAYKKTKMVILVLAGIFCVLGVLCFTNEYFTFVGIYLIFCAVLMGVAVLLQGKMGITVTTTRVYGRTMFSEVSLPMHSVTMTRKSGVKNLRIESPSENFVFSFCNKQARDEVYDVINRQIAERNNSKGNVTVVNSTSNADELKKYNDLLEGGIISQEEFEAKKKQLLGL